MAKKKGDPQKAFNPERGGSIFSAITCVGLGGAFAFAYGTSVFTGLIMSFFGAAAGFAVFAQICKSSHAWPLDKEPSMADAAKKGHLTRHILSKLSPTRHIAGPSDIIKAANKILTEINRFFITTKKEIPSIKASGKTLQRSYFHPRPPPPNRRFDVCSNDPTSCRALRARHSASRLQRMKGESDEPVRRRIGPGKISSTR